MTPSADVRAESRLTPRMQIYCVSALAAKLMIWEGTEISGKKAVVVVVRLLILIVKGPGDDDEVSRLVVEEAAEKTEIGAEAKSF